MRNRVNKLQGKARGGDLYLNQCRNGGAVQCLTFVNSIVYNNAVRSCKYVGITPNVGGMAQSVQRVAAG
jgi:hypothetical protein